MRVVLDVSTSLAWQRPPVGIVRTERKFAAFLLAQRAVDVAFCRFDRASRSYREVSATEVRRLLGLDVAPSPPGPEAAVDAAPPPAVEVAHPPRRVRAALRAALERGIARLPSAAQEDAALVVRSANHLAKGLYWLARRPVVAALARFRERPAPMLPPDPAPATVEPPATMSLGPGDVYVSMGLDWEYNDLETLARLKRTQGFRTILYCYDVIPVRFPHLMSFDARQVFAKYFVDVAHVADHVVAISRATRDDYRAFLAEVGAPEPPISVVRLGTDLAAGGRGAPPQPDLAERPFVLCVGTIEARKNHELLYNVWDRLIARHGAGVPLLVVVGMAGWGVADLLSRIRLNSRVADAIVILQHVDDAGLVWLYEHALFTVYPSFVEGWGLPVVESLALGTPCLASTARAVAEAAEGLVPTLDPLDFPSWLEHVDRWSTDPAALLEARRRLAGYRAPSWHAHGEAMIGLVHDLVGTELCASSI